LLLICIPLVVYLLLTASLVSPVTNNTPRTGPEQHPGHRCPRWQVEEGAPVAGITASEPFSTSQTTDELLILIKLVISRLHPILTEPKLSTNIHTISN